MRTAYLTFSYPALSQTFVVDEVEGLRERGFDVETWGISPADPAGLLTPRYRAEAQTTRTLRPLRWGSLGRAHARALAQHPRAYLSTLVRAVADRPPGARSLLLALGTFAAAISMWAELRERSTRHLHVHFAGSPTHVAALVTAFGNTAEPTGPRWTWSVSVHGPVEFTDLTASGLHRRLRQAQFVVAISDFARSQVLTGLPSEMWHKVRVIRCGIDPSEFPSRDRGDDGGGLRVLCVGRLVALKGQPVLLEAVAALRRQGVDARLTLVGDGPELAGLKRLTAALGLDDRVTFAGALGRDRVRDHYANADVFCLPSFAEGVPVVLMEAMSTGLPVVTTPVAGIPELVDHERSGLLVRPGRADELAAALARLARDPDSRRRMGEQGRAKVEREHDVAGTVARLADLHLEFRGA